MISGAEASRIGGALSSVAGWTSEIIVVLNEDVRDGTEEVALAAGAKVFRERWKGHIAQKNSAADKAGQPWVLGLDADEAVSEALAAEIRSWLERPGAAEDTAAFSFPRCTLFGGRWIRHGDWYPDRQMRLWRRGSARWGGIDPHDKLIVNGPTRRLKSDLLHYSGASIDGQIANISSYSDDFVRAWREGRARSGPLDLAFRPLWRFFRGYFLRLGFLDGWQGYYIAWMTAFHSATRHAKVRLERQSVRTVGDSSGGKRS